MLPIVYLTDQKRENQRNVFEFTYTLTPFMRAVHIYAATRQVGLNVKWPHICGPVKNHILYCAESVLLAW